MATGYEVLKMLIPQGGWSIVGNEFEGISFIECDPITKKQFEEGFARYDSWKAEQDELQASIKSALLERLGITAEEARILLS